MNSLIISPSRHATFTNFLSRSRRVIVQKKSRFEIIDIPSLESREKSASFKGRSWISLEGKKKMAARIFGKRNILVNNQSDRDRFLDFASNFRGRRGGRERERERSACLPRVHACMRQLTAGSLASGSSTRGEHSPRGPSLLHTRKKAPLSATEREKKKKGKEGRKDRLPGARSSFRAN